MDKFLSSLSSQLLLSCITIEGDDFDFKIIAIFFKRWTDSIKSDDTRKATEYALERLGATAQTVVLELNQTQKQLGSDGKLSSADARILLQQALQRVMERLPADALATLQATYGDRLTGVAIGKIESTVAASKTCN